MPDASKTKAWFTRQVEENSDSLYSLAHRLTRNGTDAEDLVADCVARAWTALLTLEDRSRFRPWIFRILHNRFISDYRKKSSRPVEMGYDESTINNDNEDVASLLIRQPDEFLNWWANPEYAFANQLLGEDIIAAIEQLPESFRVTVVLINVEGLSYDETAEVLGVPQGTVRSRMRRGRTLLQKALWHHAKEAVLVTSNVTMESKI
jgi:RNA polymerase sigma-70 factor (ECF subfamily)